MKKMNLRTVVFLALCCDMGLFAKRLISPFANVITDALHIPGGIGTSFSLMFLVVAAMLIPCFGCGTIMAGVQSVLALCFGMVGSMGALSPIGYILPGVTIDLVLLSFGCGTIMAGVQSVLALCFGMVGSMGALSPIGYILPGVTIDLVLLISRRMPLSIRDRMVLANMLAAVCACLTANIIVFRLSGLVLMLYGCVAAVSGTLCGFLGERLVLRLMPVIGAETHVSL